MTTNHETVAEAANLRRILAEIKEVATDFGKSPADDIARLCDVNYLASRAISLLPAKQAHPDRARSAETGRG